LPIDSTSSARSAGRATARGMPGKPPPLPMSTKSATPRSRRTPTAARLSTTWRTAIAAGARIAVRLIAAFQATSRRTWSSIARRARGSSASPISARPAVRAAPYAGGRSGSPSTRVGSGSRGRFRHSSCRSCLWGPSGLRSRRRRTSHRRSRPRSSVTCPVRGRVSPCPSQASLPE
jgi:hypothetical protein